MPRLTDLLITLILLFAALPQPAKAFDLGGAIDSFFDDLSDAAEDAQKILCATREINPYLCLAATVADDVIGEIADPTPCGAPGQGTCIALIDPKRFKEIGGPCERGLIEIPNVICVAPVSTEEAVWTAEDIAWLALALVEAYQSFKVQDPRKLIDLLSAIEDPDAERVEQIVRDSQYFDEAFAIMSRLGMDTATMSVSGGGFVLLGGGAEGGVALDTGIEALPQVYRTQVSSFGIQAGAGIDLLIGGWVPSNCDIVGKAIGRGFQVDAGPGVGSAIWFDDQGTFVGTTVGVGMIGVGGGVAKMIANTEILGNNCEVQDDDPVVVLPPPRPAPEPGRITVAASDTL